jgi:hypothetical protein
MHELISAYRKRYLEEHRVQPVLDIRTLVEFVELGVSELTPAIRVVVPHPDVQTARLVL